MGLTRTKFSLSNREEYLPVLVRRSSKLVLCVIGTLLFLRHFAFVLFDSGPSNSFISSIFVQHMCLEVEPLSSIFSISTPFEEVILSKEKIRACQIEIANHALDITLLVLDM